MEVLANVQTPDSGGILYCALTDVPKRENKASWRAWHEKLEVMKETE
jgi:hypothetical protein